jgi:hypothetical protein
MTKKVFKKNRFDRFNDDPEGYENGYHDRLIEHRKDKRIRNALRSKDIRSLLEIDEDRYYD